MAFMLAVLLGDAEARRRGEARPARRLGHGDRTLGSERFGSMKASGGVVFDQVSKRYGKVTAVDECRSGRPGQLVTLLGPSGSARRRRCEWSRGSNR